MVEIDKDFLHLISSTQSGHYPCPQGKCRDFGVCDCMVITDFQIEKIDFTAIVRSVYRQVFRPDGKVYSLEKKINEILYGFSSDFDLHLVERILSINKLYLPEKWNVTVDDGYYGQRISKIEMLPNIHQKITEDITHIIQLKTLKDKMTFVLNEEYGFVSQSDWEKNWTIEEVPIDRIVFPNSIHQKVAKSKNIEYYRNYPFSIFGVCIKSGDKYQVIDGYHRITHTQNKIIKIIQIN